MSTLVRRVRSQFRQSTDNTDVPPPLPPKDSKYRYLESKRQNRCDLSTAVESAYSIRNRQEHRNQSDQNPISELRRKLVSRASTFTLRFKSRRTDLRDLSQTLRDEDPIFALERDEESSNLSVQARQSNINEVQGAIVPGAIPHFEPRPSSTSACSHIVGIPTLQPKDLECNLGIQQEDRQPIKLQKLKDEGLNTTHVDSKWSTMASESAAPPIPYERMKDIATSACDTALSSITRYNHADTESWNTTIINTILAALVEETTPDSTSPSPTGQPQFKYVVNSTIIQHTSSPAAIEDGTKASGRRGMHSASGAYWNNEKDGMWSFKYEAAEAKGLDVVVGIIWVWVG